MTTGDWVWTYRGPDGTEYAFGDGEDVGVSEIDGLDGYDQVRSSTKPIPRGHGGVPGSHYLPARTPVFKLQATAETQAELEGWRQAAMDALTPSVDEDGTLTWQRPGQDPRMMFCRPVLLSWPTTADTSAMQADPQVVFEAADPRTYAAVPRSYFLKPYSVSGGINSPVNDIKDAVVTGLEVVATNDGNTGAPPVVRFYGPTTGTCTGVQLLNLTTGVTFDVQTNIVAGQILTVDMRARVAAIGGLVVSLSGSDRYGSWQTPRDALLIARGSNVLRFTGDGTTAGMICRVDYQDAWIA
jgi:hypothetical protein